MSNAKTKHADAVPSCLKRLVRGFSLFMNWFNGILAPFCGTWMMLSAVPGFPFSWESWMPLSVFNAFPFHELLFASYLLPGLALMLVVGLPNIVALVARRKHNDELWSGSCLMAGALLVVWTVIEMLFIPNGLSVFYLILGVLQVVSAVLMDRML